MILRYYHFTAVPMKADLYQKFIHETYIIYNVKLLSQESEEKRVSKLVVNYIKIINVIKCTLFCLKEHQQFRNLKIAIAKIALLKEYDVEQDFLLVVIFAL